ncbi:MAG: efflux RND transporter periplasmic adaptor subunit, partial [Elainellaceae cyanobacterium]
QAQSEKNIAQARFDALESQTPLQSSTEDLQAHRRRLLQDIQAEVARIQVLESKLQVQQIQSSSTPAMVETQSVAATVPIAAPFDGVVYNTRRDTGEQVNRPNVLLSLLDCKNLWVEALVSVEQAKRIDVDQPVRLQLASSDETVVGEIEFVNAISNGTLTESRAEALLPAVPASLVGQPIARVRVSMPPTLMQEQSYQFCGVGQSVTLTFGTQLSL